jgi:hypothetical protein
VPRNSGLAIASLVCSLSSLVTCIGWLPGIICGHLAKSRLRRDPMLKGTGLATAGLIIGYLMLTAEAGTVGVKLWSFSKALKQGIATVQQGLATNAVTVVQSQSTAATNDSPAAEPAAVGWTDDLSQMAFPEQPASGRLHGLDFTLKAAALRAGNLKLTAENGCLVEVLGLGAAVEGHSFEIPPADDAGKVRVRLTWNDGAAVQTTTFNDDYRLKLEFGQANKRKMAGKIYVCLPDDAKSYVAGTFDVRLPKPK